MVVERNIKNAMEKMLKRLSLIAVLLMCSFAVTAQVTIDIDETVNERLRMKNAQIDSSKLQGFRIQIAFSSDRGVIDKARQKFLGFFPEFEGQVYILYQQPNYKLRVGNYIREIDAQKILGDIREQFPNAYLVKDYIKRP